MLENSGFSIDESAVDVEGEHFVGVEGETVGHLIEVCTCTCTVQGLKCVASQVKVMRRRSFWKWTEL